MSLSTMMKLSIVILPVCFTSAYSNPLACSIWIREIVDSAVQIKECLIHEANSVRKTFLSPKNSGLLSNVWCMLFRLEKLNLFGVIY
jgi:hypothetical protein